MKRQYFYLDIPNEVCNQGIEEFLQTDLKMKYDSSGISFITYRSKKMPERFEEKIREMFGSYTWNSIYFEER